MRRAWGKLYNKKKHLEPNKRVLAEQAGRARYYSDASIEARHNKEEYLRQRVLQLTGIDLDRVFKRPSASLNKPNEPREQIEGHLAFLRAIEERGSRYDHSIVLHNGALQRVLLFYTSKWDACFFVRVDIDTKIVSVSIRYNSRQRAFKVYRTDRITWIGNLVPG